MNICLMGMAEDPEWVQDHGEYLCRINHQPAGNPFCPGGFTRMASGITMTWASSSAPFMSPSMYKEILQPGHTRTISYAHSKNLPVP